MEQYATNFEVNAIDLEVAAMLTDADLKEIVVSALGHRKRFLKAIAALRKDATPHPGADPERRLLTVMFCDLVGSTALSVRLDPEDMATLIGGYQRCCTDAVRRFDGFVARYVGDGILVYFGYPHAHEDDAERAALALIKDMKRDANLRDLELRVGIATGPVVVGDFSIVGGGERDAVIGETPNLAARLQSAADPGAVIISATTHRLIGNAFDCVELPPLALQGFEAPVRAWSVLGKHAFTSRFEARQAAGLTPCVDRTRELDLLWDRWRSAQAGNGQTVLLIGEPGIGKSRIYQELGNRIASTSHGRSDYFGSPYLKNSPLAPIIARFERDCDVRIG
jgi:class 3 adenylate cyclase